MANIVTSFLGWVGKESKIALADIIKYIPPAAKIAELLFPQFSAEIAAGSATVVDVTTLIQNAVVSVEQKYAASGVASGTGTQKSDEVLALVGPVVISLLQKAGITNADSSYVQSIVNAVVALLNIPGTAPATSTAPAAS